VNDGETITLVVRNGHDAKFDSAIVRPDVHESVTLDGGLTRVDHRSEDVGVPDAMLSR
jgi:hypothetical protein